MKKWLLRLLSIVIFALLISLGYYTYQIWSAMEHTYDSSGKSNKRPSAISLHEAPVVILLLGVDEHKGDVGRSDTITITAINPHQKSLILTNIPRDTLVTIPGRANKDKINHSYAYGGVQLTRNTVENFLDLPIDACVKVNMQGLKEIVDVLGGVDVQVPFEFIYEGVHFRPGPMHLNGNEALAFVRMRKVDPLGDFGRIKREQELIRAIIRKGSHWTSITKMDDVMQKMGDNVKTDIPPLEWIRFKNLYSAIPESNIYTVNFKGKNVMLNGIYYYKIPDQEVRRVHNILAKQMELEPTNELTR